MSTRRSHHEKQHYPCGCRHAGADRYAPFLPCCSPCCLPGCLLCCLLCCLLYCLLYCLSTLRPSGSVAVDAPQRDVCMRLYGSRLTVGRSESIVWDCLQALQCVSHSASRLTVSCSSPLLQRLHRPQVCCCGLVTRFCFGKISQQPCGTTRHTISQGTVCWQGKYVVVFLT